LSSSDLIPPRVRRMERVSAPRLSPAHGPLSGLRVLFTGTVIAGPFIATLLADYGAEVIHVERPGQGDTFRGLGPFYREEGKVLSAPFANDSRNKLSVTLDLRIDRSPEAKEVFLGLIKQSDIWVENLVWIEKRYGITEELVFEANPRIVIVRVSGYGNARFGGDPDRCDRAAYDLIGQAYAGWPNVVGTEDMPPTRVGLWACDYITSMMGTIGALAAYVEAQRSGIGQVVDVAQYEAVARIMESYFVAYLNAGIERKREGNKARSFQPYGIFRARDGYVALGAFGPGVYERFLEAFCAATGIPKEEFPYERCAATPEAVSSPDGRKLDEALTRFVSERTCQELEDLFNSYSVPCSRITTPKDAAQDPHWISRELFVKAFDGVLEREIFYFGVVPKFSRTPGRVWRGTPKVGQDTEAVLKEILGYSEEEIESLRAKGVI